MESRKFFSKNKWYFLGFLVLIAVVSVNIFPRGYVFSGGDTAQLINAKESFRKLFFDWNGATGIFYFVFYLLSKLGISESVQLSWYLGIFIFGSYIAFDIFSRLLFGDISDPKKMFVSLFYALNLYTLFIFSGNWGYSYFPSLYIFIPVLLGLFIKFLETHRFIFGSLFGLVLLLSSSGFGNPAFFISFFIFLVLVFFSLAIAGHIKPDKKMFSDIFILTTVSFLIMSFSILPVIPEVKSGVEKVYNSEVLEFNYVIRSTASPIANTVSLIHFTRDHFPYNFPYESLSFLRGFFIIISFFPVIFATLGIFFIRNFPRDKKRIFLSFWLVFFSMVLLAARVTSPFEVINYYIYHIWGMDVMRGFDKTGIYIPFILSVLILIVLSGIRSKSKVFFSMMIIILIPLPFYFGKLQQTVGYRNQNGKNLKNLSISFLVKIPEEYYEIKPIINEEKQKSFVAVLPYTRNDGSGISDYPKWKLYGFDLTQYLYNKNYIIGNSSTFGGWLFSRSFNDELSLDVSWMAKILGMMNVEYIIYHKDATKDAVAKTQLKMEELEKESVILKMADNEYFTLYKLSDDYFMPYLSWQKGDIKIDGNASSVNEKFDDLKDATAGASFREINPKKYLVDFENGKSGRYLVLAEPYDSSWRAYYILKNGEEKEIENHFTARGYANGWEVGDNPEIEKIFVEYYPERLMWRGMSISLATALFLLFYLIKYYYAGKIRKKSILIPEKTA